MMLKDFFARRKLEGEFKKELAKRLAEEVAKSTRYNELLKTDNFYTVIKELIEQAEPGLEVTITLNSGHKIELKRQIQGIPREFETPFF